MAKALPKAERAIIAAHDAGMHDKRPTPATCPSCTKDLAAKADVLAAVKPEPIPAKDVTKVALPSGRTVMTTTPAALDPDRKKSLGARAALKPTRVRTRKATLAPETIVVAKPKPASILGGMTVPEGGFPTREAWMLAAVEAIRPWFKDEGEELPVVRISVGWPGGRGNKQNVLGQCWAATTVGDGIPALFVSPSQHEAVEVLETIIHESIHAAGHMHHRSPFQKVARKFGFVNGGKTKTSREQSPDLYATLDELAAALGPFPHSPVKSSGGLAGGDPKAPPVQSTRMIKVWCENDGYTLRATRKWLNVAIPLCPVCESTMEVER